MSSPLYKKAKQVVGNQEECTICQEVFNALRLIDGNPLIEAQIESFLSNQLCAKLSKTLIQECNATVQTFLPELINLVNSELTPQVICHLLSLCPNTTANPSVPQKSAANPSVLQKVQGISADVQGSEECVLCEFVLKELDQMLANNASEAEILAALDKVCSVFPDTLQVQCRDFVDMYGKSILELLLQELEPSTICRALGLCPQKHEFNQINGEEECAICKTIVIYMRSLLSKNATEQEIEKVLAKVCNFVPDTMKQDCSNFIQLYGGTLIKLLVSDVTPQEVCGILKLCQQRVTQPLLGAKECTWGPSYWCASKENAAKCKAEEHCQRYVWKK
jgi:saposin